MSIVDLAGVEVSFRHAGRKRAVQVLSGVDLKMSAGETVGIVGESGSGKTTLGRVITGLVRPDSGRLCFDGRVFDPRKYGPRPASALGFRMVFQDPAGSLDPKMTVRACIAEGLGQARTSRAGRDKAVKDVADAVHLPAQALNRRPNELSGGQQQRVAIARAIVASPKLVVLDEAVSALDMRTQAAILDLLKELQHAHALTYLFISHDLDAVRAMSSRVLVMYLGQVVEEGPASTVTGAPAHPYTICLKSAAPLLDPAKNQSRRSIPPIGEPGTVASVPSGCRFHPRCPIVDLPMCAEATPMPRDLAAEHAASCHHAGEFESRFASGQGQRT